MWRSTAIAAVIAALVVGGPGIATASAKRAGSEACAGAYVVATDAATLAKASGAVLCLVNRERAARGLGAVRASGALANAATGHSANMVAGKFFSHGRGADSVYKRVASVGYPWTAVGETIAWGAGRRAMPYRLVATFLQSGVHRSIVLAPNFRDLGVGLALGAPTRSARGASSTLTLVFGDS